MRILKTFEQWPRARLAERVSAASYGTVLVLAALAVLHPEEVETGLGWELVTGVGVATWLAHLFAEIVGDRLRNVASLDRKELRHAAADGLPILLAGVLPALMLLLGRVDVLTPRTALWASVVVAIMQLVAVGGFVGRIVSESGAVATRYAMVTALFGLFVVALKLRLGH